MLYEWSSSTQPINYEIWSISTPRVFNLGDKLKQYHLLGPTELMKTFELYEKEYNTNH